MTNHDSFLEIMMHRDCICLAA